MKKQPLDCHSELLQFVSKGRPSAAWNAFAEHLQLLHQNDSLASIDSTTFDELFNLIQKNTDDNHARFNKLRVLIEYADVYRLPISDAQWHAVADIFLSLWEACHSAGEETFGHIGFYHMLVHVIDKDENFASRLVTALANASLVREANEFAKTCRHLVSPQAWESLLQACLHHQEQGLARTVGLEILQEGTLDDADHLILSFLSRHFSSQELSELTEGFLEKDNPGLSMLKSSATRSSLTPILALLEVRSGTFGLAQSLLSSDGLSSTPALQILFAEASLISALQHLHEREPCVSLQTSIAFFGRSRWKDVEIGRRAMYAIIEALLKSQCTVDDRRTLIRNFTLMVLKLDHDLATLSDEAAKVLMRLHIGVEEYGLARHVFRTYEKRSATTTKTPFVNRRDFLWMFQAALHQADNQLQDSWQLFMHWTMTDCGALLEYLPLSLMRKFIQLNTLNNRAQSIPFLLQHLHLESNVRSRHNFVKAAQSSRLIDTLINVPREVRHEVLPVLLKVLDSLRRSERTKTSNVIDFHLNVLWRLSQLIDRHDALDRAQCLKVFEDLRVYAKEKLSVPLADEGMAGKLIAVYITAMKVMRMEISAFVSEDTNKVILLIEELEQFWRLDVDQIDTQSVEAVITSTRIIAFAAQARWQEATMLVHKNVEAVSANRNAVDANEDHDLQHLPLVPATVISRLALAMGQSGEYTQARALLSYYTRNVPERNLGQEMLTTADRREVAKAHDIRLLLEAAGITLLCMQGNTQEALDRIYSLQRLGVFGRPKRSVDLPSSFAMPVFGPSNRQLAKTFAEPINTRSRPLFKEGDWHGEMRKASEKLLEATALDDILDDKCSEDGPFFSNFQY
jgi:hypothetical protein